MTEQEQAKLKPCPFCGGEAQIVTRDVEPQGDPWYGGKSETFPECTNCGAVKFNDFWHDGFWEEDKTKPVNAIKAWNTRADPEAKQVIAALVEALQSARGKLNYIAVQGGLNHPGFNTVAKMNAEAAVKTVDEALATARAYLEEK